MVFSLTFTTLMLSLVILAEHGIYVEPFRSVAGTAHFITDVVPYHSLRVIVFLWLSLAIPIVAVLASRS